ncbi:MAG: hypothetical protein ABI846_00880 [Rudaea sp.]
MRAVPAIAFDYRPSRQLAALLVAAATLAVVATLASGLDDWIKLLVTVAALAHGARTLWRFLHLPVDRVTWHAAGHWRVRVSTGPERSGEFVSARVLGPVLVLVLRIGPRQTVALPLLYDNCDDDTRRRLRVRLARGQAPR